MSATVTQLHLSPTHSFTKESSDSLHLLAGLGVEGDAHCGARVRHRSRVAADPSQPNLRQVHLLQGELHDELAAQGFSVRPGDLGENVTTRGLDLLSLPTGTVLRLGSDALICLTGLRNPCPQIEAFQEGLLSRVVERDESGRVRRKAGVMAVVVRGGVVHVGDAVEASLPPEPHVELERV